MTQYLFLLAGHIISSLDHSSSFGSLKESLLLPVPMSPSCISEYTKINIAEEKLTKWKQGITRHALNHHLTQSTRQLTSLACESTSCCYLASNLFVEFLTKQAWQRRTYQKNQWKIGDGFLEDTGHNKTNRLCSPATSKPF